MLPATSTARGVREAPAAGVPPSAMKTSFAPPSMADGTPRASAIMPAVAPPLSTSRPISLNVSARIVGRRASRTPAVAPAMISRGEPDVLRDGPRGLGVHVEQGAVLGRPDAAQHRDVAAAAQVDQQFRDPAPDRVAHLAKVDHFASGRPMGAPALPGRSWRRLRSVLRSGRPPRPALRQSGC